MMDKFGNDIAHEGCDRCECGCKYWENDVCMDCGTTILKHLFYVALGLNIKRRPIWERVALGLEKVEYA